MIVVLIAGAMIVMASPNFQGVVDESMRRCDQLEQALEVMYRDARLPPADADQSAFDQSDYVALSANHRGRPAELS
jgi:hypothetical protein